MFTFPPMQNNVQPHVAPMGRLVGFVRVVVGGKVCDVAVQAVSFDSDGERDPGGFFEKDGQLGILVDESAPDSLVEAQLKKATEEAIAHLSKKVLN